MIIISPSKRQAKPDYKSGLKKPLFLEDTAFLASALNMLSLSELKGVLNISDVLVAKAYDQYQNLDVGSDVSMAAIDLYQGDVFKHLDAKHLSDDEIQYLENNLQIISPLYGLVTPLTGIWPYRLEMISKIPMVKNLPSFWEKMQQAIDINPPQYIFNLASKEYAGVLSTPQGTKWIDIVFQDKNASGQYRIIAIKAKRMRGELLQYMAKHKINTPEHLCAFTHPEYEFSEDVSTPQKLVFRSI